MEELRELVKIVTRRGQKKIALLDFKENGHSSKEMRLLQKVRSGEYTTDEQAIIDLYGDYSSLSRYKMLKSRLKKKLLNHLFFLDYSDRQSKAIDEDEQECLNLVHHTRILIKEHEYVLAEGLVQKALRIALHMDFAYIVVSCLGLLILIHARNGKTQALYKAREQLEVYRRIEYFEQETRIHYAIAQLELNKSVQTRTQYLPKLLPILSKMRTWWEKTHSSSIFNYYHILNIWYQELTGNYAEIIKITAESEKLLQANQINKERFNHIINKYTSVYAHLRIKNYENGIRLAQEYLPAFSRNSNNWFTFSENYFLLALHAKKYEMALEIIHEVDQNPALKKITPLAKERWTLYRNYLYFVHPDSEPESGFTYQSFIAGLPEYSKDKQGFNVAILVLQFLHYLRKNDAEALMHRVEALKIYERRYLRGNFSDRTKALFRLLMMVVREDFEVSRCRKKGKYLYERLQVLQTPGDAYAEIEIIPYEQIWELILDILQEKKMLQIRAIH